MIGIIVFQQKVAIIKFVKLRVYTLSGTGSVISIRNMK